MMKMKRGFVLGIACLFVLLVFPFRGLAQTGINYGTKTLVQWQSANYSEFFDLTKCDLTLVYEIDMSQIAAGWSVIEVGLRQLGNPNIDPNLFGGWMQSNYQSGASNPTSLNGNDIHLLSKHGWLYQTYDATDANTLISPYWSNNNHGFWFDRDGVDQWQAAMWGMIDGGVYNTAGKYKIVITYHAIDPNTATMFATINGVKQGLYIGGYKNAQPEFYPAGRSFIGDMTKMQIFYGRGGGGGIVTLKDMSVIGCVRTIMISNCDTGIPDKVYNGKLISVSIADFAATAKNQGAFVSFVAKLTNDVMKAGLITGEQKGAIQRCAAQAEIPY